MPVARSERPPRPPSAVSAGVGLSGLAALGLWLLFAREFGRLAAMLGWQGAPAHADGPYAALACTFVVGLTMVLWSLLVDRVHRRPSTGIDWSLRRPISAVLDDSIIKIAGLWVTWGGIALIYSLFRFWWTTEFAPYPFAMKLLGAAAGPLVILSVPYVIWLDRHLIEPRDDSWAFGAMIAGRPGWCREAVYRHLRAWAVKGFFLAFMLSILPGGYQAVVNADVTRALAEPVAASGLLISAMFVVDVQLATMGYMLTIKPLDAHIRSANPLLAGWVAALACYPPFALMRPGGVLEYHAAEDSWTHLLAGHNGLLWLWGALLVVLTAIYASATVAFGLRFSNLTNRGILTHGPYAWSRHPAYLAKNSYWWLAGLPFLALSGGWAEAARNCAMLGTVSAIYYWRAKTEERHLMADPTYRAYWEWMEAHGPVPRAFRTLRRLLVPRRTPARLPEAHPAE